MKNYRWQKVWIIWQGARVLGRSIDQYQTKEEDVKSFLIDVFGYPKDIYLTEGNEEEYQKFKDSIQVCPSCHKEIIYKNLVQSMPYKIKLKRAIALLIKDRCPRGWPVKNKACPIQEDKCEDCVNELLGNNDLWIKHPFIALWEDGRACDNKYFNIKTTTCSNHYNKNKDCNLNNCPNLPLGLENYKKGA